jgi:hypothetical protein
MFLTELLAELKLELFMRKIFVPSFLNFRWIIFLVLVLIQFSLAQFIQSQLQEQLRSIDGMTPWIWILALGQITLVATGEALLTLVGFSIVAPAEFDSLGNKVSRSCAFNQLLIEILRSWGSILRGLLLFLVPGLIRMFRYLFVPFVVLLHPRYWEGKVDVLKESARITGSLTTKEWCVLILVKLGFPLALSFVSDGAGQFWLTPLATLSVVVLESGLVLITLHWMSRTFEKRL